MDENQSVDESVSEGKGLQFVVESGKTFFQENAEVPQLFGDFSLKLQGELLSEEQEKYGFWVATCTAATRGQLETKNIVLPANSFDSKSRFMTELRSRFGSGVLNLGGGVTASTLAEYYSFCKRDLGNHQMQFYKAQHLGYQKDGYWYLSNQLHICDEELVSPLQRKFFVIDNEVLQYSTVLDEHLLNEDYLRDISQRIIQLSDGFGVNKASFLLSTAFVIYSNMKPVLKTLTRNFSDESSIGILYSQDRNVGKSLTLQLMALAQGVISPHPLFCSGGDQNMSGVTQKLLTSILSSTNLTCLVDDIPAFNKQLTEWLLQIQSGLPQGSLKTGLVTPVGNVLISSNCRENERLYGRGIVFQYKIDGSFDATNDRALDELKVIFSRNKGFCIAWVIMMRQEWLEKAHIITKLADVLKPYSPDGQSRWSKGTAAVLYTYYVFQRAATGSLNKETVANTLLHMIVNSKAVESKKVSFWARFNKEIKCALERDTDSPLTWLNPSVNVVVDDDYVPALGITSTKVSSFTSVGNKETKENMKSVIDGNLSLTSSMRFAANNEAKIKDVRAKKAGLSKNAKGYKVPLTYIESDVYSHIQYACGLNADKPEENEPSNSGATVNAEEAETLKKMNEVANEITSLFDIDRDVSAQSQQRPPRTRPLPSFLDGIAAGLRIATGSTDATYYAEDNRTPSPRAKRRLVVSASGAVGVRPCTQQAAANQRDDNDDICHQCRNAFPPSAPSTRSDVLYKWIQCDSNVCKRWYHEICVNVNVDDYKSSKWYCALCSANGTN
ncbi:hypothetical protein AC249_AIPGENE4236 [Exaiptasia diaphana]|nr:hypothetical protein AC249_AIPGENE4236 [Exaiptasia diaphana]